MRPIFSNVTKIGIFDIVFIFTIVNDDPSGPYSIFMNPFSKHIHRVIPSLIDKDALNMKHDIFVELGYFRQYLDIFYCFLDQFAMCK